LVLALLAVPILGEQLRGRTLVAIGISLIGILLIATGGDLTTLQVKDPYGVGLALISAGIWALYWLATVRDQRDAVVKMVMGFFFGSGYSLLLLPILSVPRLPSLQEFLLAGYVGIAEMGLTFVFWLKVLETAPDKGAIANCVYIAPFLSLALIALILKEAIAPASVLGLIVIIASILWQSRHSPSSG
jgi:drug/metabolite transporter (DMT)-like permease